MVPRRPDHQLAVLAFVDDGTRFGFALPVIFLGAGILDYRAKLLRVRFGEHELSITHGTGSKEISYRSIVRAGIVATPLGNGNQRLTLCIEGPATRAELIPAPPEDILEVQQALFARIPASRRPGSYGALPTLASAGWLVCPAPEPQC